MQMGGERRTDSGASRRCGHLELSSVSSKGFRIEMEGFVVAALMFKIIMTTLGNRSHSGLAASVHVGPPPAISLPSGLLRLTSDLLSTAQPPLPCLALLSPHVHLASSCHDPGRGMELRRSGVSAPGHFGAGQGSHGHCPKLVAP